jgi:iron complex outermembrane recepter protein
LDDVLLVRNFLEMRRAGVVGTVARYGATLLGGVALLAWFESPAQSQAPQGGNSLPPVTVDAPTQQSVRRAPTKRNEARVRSTSRRTTAPSAPQAETVAVQSQPSQPGVVPAFAGGQVAQGARLGMLGNTSTMKSPFNVTSYTDKFIRDLQAATGADALILDPSVRSTHPTGGIVDSFTIRGFPINEGNNGEFAFEGLYGIAPSFRIFTDYVERLEVLKGPSAALSGIAPNGGVGGVINVVPKRAGEDLTRLTASYGSAARFGGHWDVARRYGDSKEWGVRASGSLRGGDTPIDRQSETTGVGALALDYQGERYRSWIYFIAQTDRFDAPSRPFLMTAGQQVPKAPDGRLNVTQPWEWSRINDQSVLWRNEYDVTDQVTLFADVGGSRTNVERFFGLPTINNNINVGNTTSTPQFFGLSIDRHTYDGGVRARFDTGFVRHAVTFQASVYHDALHRRTVNGSPVTSNIYNPTVAPTQFANEISDRPRLSDSQLTGLSIADTMSVLDERVLLTLGVRRQGVEANNYFANVGTLLNSYDKSATTPVVGLVVRPRDNVSLYANYIEGLSRGDIAPSQPNVSNGSELLPPHIAKQYEAGITAGSQPPSAPSRYRRGAANWWLGAPRRPPKRKYVGSSSTSSANSCPMFVSSEAFRCWMAP